MAGHHFTRRQPADTWSLPLQKGEENYFLLTPQENDLREVHVCTWRRENNNPGQEQPHATTNHTSSQGSRNVTSCTLRDEGQRRDAEAKQEGHMLQHLDRGHTKKIKPKLVRHQSQHRSITLPTDN